MAETVDAGSPPPEEDESAESVSELVEQLGRDTSTLILRELQLTTSRHETELRRVVRSICLALAVGAAFLAAFVLLNWAAVEALSTSLSGWRAPAVLASAWILVGVALLFVLVGRGGRASHRPWWLLMRSDPAAAVADRQQAREQAEEALRETLKRLAAAVTREAEERIASAIVPFAGGVAEAGEELLEVGEEMIDVIEEEMPGGSVVAQMIDLALLPGRLGMRMVTMARRGSDAD